VVEVVAENFCPAAMAKSWLAYENVKLAFTEPNDRLPLDEMIQEMKL
jgi:hypothetical protein